MANIYTVIKFFDDELVAAGYTVNATDSENTTSINDGLELWTHIPDDGIVYAEQQVANFVTYDIEYIVKGIRGSSDDEQRKNDTAQDFEDITNLLYKKSPLGEDDQITFLNGSLLFNTSESYQSFFGLSFQVQYKSRITNV